MHKVTDPSILYFGTPVVLIGTVNDDASYNLAPMSSAWWLGWRCMIGLNAFSKTTLNILRTGECTLNLPSVNEVGAVDRLALTTGSNPVPEAKRARGYRFEAGKFELAEMTPLPGDLVKAPRAAECPVQMEAVLAGTYPLANDNNATRGRMLGLELRITRVHLDETILMDGYSNRVDPDKWRPLIMSFQQFYGLGEKVHPSLLGTVPEHMYRMADIPGHSPAAAKVVQK